MPTASDPPWPVTGSPPVAHAIHAINLKLLPEEHPLRNTPLGQLDVEVQKPGQSWRPVPPSAGNFTFNNLLSTHRESMGWRVSSMHIGWSWVRDRGLQQRYFPLYKAVDSSEMQSKLYSLLRLAIADPGAILPRYQGEDGEYETLPSWAARAALKLLLPDS